MSLMEHAKREIDILIKSCGDDEPIIKEFIPEILQLCKKFANSGQSGGSAPYISSAITQSIKKLMMQQPICLIQGTEDEWTCNNFDNKNSYQNNRCSAVFKNGEGKSYYLDAIVWQGEDEYDTFTGTVDGIQSRQFISFPFEPKTFYIDVRREFLPLDYDGKKDFFEDDYYDKKKFKETGIKKWKKEKYRYVIKDKSQLEKVSEHYDTDF